MTSEIPEQTVRHLRLERDRHVAFAFAAADLLVEVGDEGIIVAVSGAAHAVLGADTKALFGRPDPGACRRMRSLTGSPTAEAGADRLPH